MMKLSLALVILFLSPVASAHVKWFSDYSLNQKPLSWEQLHHFSFWFLFTLSTVAIGGLVYANEKLERWLPYRKLNGSLESHYEKGPVILRIFTGASLLLSWQADSMIAPELKLSHPAWGWYQFGLALLMLGARSSIFAGAGMILLYGYAISQYGLFHLLDYLVYAAIGYFLLVHRSDNIRLRSTRIPALYVGLGFSLCWAALEKIYYPDWGMSVLREKPALTLGLDPHFFLLACAFVELSLGYLLTIGILQRSLALVITLVFFTTSAFFGKTEVVGHTILHGALLVFIVMGPGRYFAPPIAWHKRFYLKVAFASVNFVLLMTFLLWSYRYFAELRSQHTVPANEAQQDEV